MISVSWTRGQSSNINQSPYKDPVKDDRGTPISPNYKPTNNNRRDVNTRPPQSSQPQQGHMKDIVASFSQEGLQTFSTIFSSSVEAAIAKTLPDLVERAIEKKMKQVIDEALNNANQLFMQFLSQIVLNTQTAIESRLNELIDDQLKKQFPVTNTSVVSVPDAHEVNHEVSTSEVAELSQVVAQSESIQDAPAAQFAEEVTSPTTPDGDDEPVRPIENRLAHDFEKVIAILQSAGHPLSAEELRQAAEDVEWGNNFTVKMNRFIQKSNGQIERVGKGVYQFKAD